MKIKDKEECDFCGERDTIPHFFANCPLSQKLWIEAERKVSSYLGKIIKFEEKIILLGIWCKDYYCQNELRYINRVCLIGKSTISKFKFHKIGNIILSFENELRERGL